MALLLTLIIMNLMIMIPKATSDAPNFVAQYCLNTSSTYTTNSRFSTNLKTLFGSLSSNAATNPTGFNITSVTGGGTDDAVYGLFLCRGDQNTSGCNDCVATAAREQPKRITCPNTKAGILWYDECILRYDSQPVSGTSAPSYMLMLFNTANISGSQPAFVTLLRDTINDLMVQAANSLEQTGKKYANKEVAIGSSLQNLYAMAQCTPDLSTSDCSRCLTNGINGFNAAKQGGDMLKPSCIIRYEIYPFLDTPFNSSTTKSPSLWPTPPPPSPSTTNSTNGTSLIAGPHGNKKVSIVVIIAIVVPATIIAAIILVTGSWFILKKSKNNVVVENGEDISIVQSLQYESSTLKFATNNFSVENKLGEGGFGGVYKGTLNSGQEIAVKKLSKTSSQGVQEFKNEVLVVAKLQHRNLVRLLGFSLDGEEKLLVYEYVANKSLDYFLFDPKKQAQLDWRRRYKIIEGIVRGMLYLHQDSQLRIIHRDLKASNILLDEEMNSKISDFGMARIVGVDQTQGNTSRIVGTYGYMSPEYAMQGQFSVKSDVYSFGVLLLEILSGMRNSSFYQTGDVEDLFSYGWKHWKDGTPLNFVDPTIRDSCSANEVMRCLQLGLSCVQESVDARPTMATIALALDSHSVTLQVPAQPISFSSAWTKSKFENGDSSEQSSAMSLLRPWSRNDVSISEVDPR